MLNSILSNYGQFFNLHVLTKELSDPKSWAIILTLVLLEGLLSADNALVLAMMVKPLPHHQQKKALTYGIWGAYFFRFLVIGIGTYLIKFTIVKAFGAIYLLYLSYKGLKGGEESHSAANAVARSFWLTILSVEAMDIVFSIDSVAAALALSDEVWVLFIGAVLGILMMRGVAQLFVSLLDKVPELEKTAYVLIAIIGIKLGLTMFHIEVPEFLFFGLLVTVFGGTFLVHNLKVEKAKQLKEHDMN